MGGRVLGLKPRNDVLADDCREGIGKGAPGQILEWEATFRAKCTVNELGTEARRGECLGEGCQQVSRCWGPK